MFRPPFPLRRALPVLVLALLVARPAIALSPRASALQEALQLADSKNWDAALAAARQAGPLGIDVIEWQRLRAGDGDFPAYADFLRQHPDWPGLGYLHYQGEASINADTPPNAVVAYFAHRSARTAAGSLALQAALQRIGQSKAAQAEAKRAWLDLSFSADQQKAELTAFGPILGPLNERRMQNLLWRRRATEAERMLPLVSKDYAALGRARIALEKLDKTGVNNLIAAVPPALRHDPGLAYDRFRYRVDEGKTDWADSLLLSRSRSAKLLGDPAVWARSRGWLARKALSENKPHTAYRIAADHHLSGGATFADLEFLAGYIALKSLNAPHTALHHFQTLGKAVTTPISLSRAAYWEARAEEALGDRKAAHADFAKGAKYQTAFYGLLSAEAIGEKLDPALLSDARFPDWHKAAFVQSPLLRTGELLLSADHEDLAQYFFLKVANGLDLSGLGQLSDMALSLHSPHIAILVAKKAAARGAILPRAYYPVTPLAHVKLPVPTDLALAIARRESEFSVSIVSPAGALGLMQLMPATARQMSSAAGLPYSRARLTSDAAYNVTLGSTYLAKLVDQFGPALTLVAAGYNAGAGRAAQWITQLGDPRAPNVDPIDWIESVPYTETRNYIMRVAESYEVYRAKLAGHPLPIRLMAELKGQR